MSNPAPPASDRACLFVDGSNWFNSLKRAQVRDVADLHFEKISRKLIGPRTWVGTRYYIGKVERTGNLALFEHQKWYLPRLLAQNPLISSHLGRIEQRPAKSELAEELLHFLHSTKTKLVPKVYEDLYSMANRHRQTSIFVEKAVDVMLAVDLVSMAAANKFDAAYVLSADGDFTPAVEAVRRMGKKVYAASPSSGHQIGAAANSFITLKREWFADCYI